MHAATFVAAVPGTFLLVALAGSGSASVTAALYGLSLLIAFGTSAAYHRLAASPRARRVMQRLDHATIFVLIAGTYAPICVLGLPARWGIPVMAATGGLALVGIILKLATSGRLNDAASFLYIPVGWAIVAATPALVRGLTPLELSLLVAGGVLYTAGFPVLMLERPDPWPRTFGYHEIWHTCTVVASGCHFASIALLVR